MTTEQMKAEMKYNTAMAIVKRMHRRGLLTDEQYTKAEQNLSKIYMPPVSGIMYQNHCNH